MHSPPQPLPTSLPDAAAPAGAPASRPPRRWPWRPRWGLAACGSSDHNASGGDQHQGQGGRHGDGQGGPGGRGVGGKITTEGAGSWQITKQDGSTETVAISATTEFGSKAKSETAAQFAVGDQIMVQGQETDGTIAATRILHARDHGTPNGTPPSSPAGTPPASPSSTPPTK
ncbi:DUF5666 domain-containing protein [Nocardia tengchongensis]|uniref:DUF5666 domain-containing protein n=1 Tax=Nocardia tengchongensis TaxID=2055889 RepID=UPI0036CFD05F